MTAGARGTGEAGGTHEDDEAAEAGVGDVRSGDIELWAAGGMSGAEPRTGNGGARRTRNVMAAKSTVFGGLRGHGLCRARV